MSEHNGGCLCGDLRYKVMGTPEIGAVCIVDIVNFERDQHLVRLRILKVKTSKSPQVKLRNTLLRAKVVRSGKHSFAIPARQLSLSN